MRYTQTPRPLVPDAYLQNVGCAEEILQMVSAYPDGGIHELALFYESTAYRHVLISTKYTIKCNGQETQSSCAAA